MKKQVKLRKLKITYEAPEIDFALDRALSKAVSKKWTFMGSGYHFRTQTRDLTFERSA
jgi:hypothetical protein